MVKKRGLRPMIWALRLMHSPLWPAREAKFQEAALWGRDREH